MSLSDEQWKFTKDVGMLILYADTEGFKLTGGELYRPQFVQDKYFGNGKSMKRHSNHQNRMAIDFNIFFKNDDNQWELLTKKTVSRAKKLGNYWEALDEKNKWGGNYKTFLDAPHFERKQ